MRKIDLSLVWRTACSGPRGVSLNHKTGLLLVAETNASRMSVLCTDNGEKVESISQAEPAHYRYPNRHLGLYAMVQAGDRLVVASQKVTSQTTDIAWKGAGALLPRRLSVLPRPIHLLAKDDIWNPLGVTVSRAGQLLVSDYNNHRVLRLPCPTDLDKELDGADYSVAWPSFMPVGITVDNDTVYVANDDRGVSVYDLESGQMKADLPSRRGSAQLEEDKKFDINRPRSVVARNDALIVSDGLLHVYSRKYQNLWRFSPLGQLRAPGVDRAYGIDWCPLLKLLFVADANGDSVSAFKSEELSELLEKDVD
jgi:DNA-binding beta-propeller fold protein YncE